jgi:hypothetical protein
MRKVLYNFLIFIAIPWKFIRETGSHWLNFWCWRLRVLSDSRSKCVMKVEFAVQPAVAVNRNLTGAIPVGPGCTHQLWFISLYVEPEGFAVVLWDPQSNVRHWRYSLIGVYGRQRLAVHLQWWIVAQTFIPTTGNEQLIFKSSSANGRTNCSCVMFEILLLFFECVCLFPQPSLKAIR